MRGCSLVASLLPPRRIPKCFPMHSFQGFRIQRGDNRLGAHKNWQAELPQGFAQFSPLLVPPAPSVVAHPPPHCFCWRWQEVYCSMRVWAQGGSPRPPSWSALARELWWYMMAGAEAEKTARSLAAILLANFYVILIDYLLFEFKNPENCALESTWVFNEEEGGTLPKNDPAKRPPPEIAKLGGGCGGTREIRGRQRKAARAMPLRGCARSQGTPWESILGPSPMGGVRAMPARS